MIPLSQWKKYVKTHKQKKNKQKKKKEAKRMELKRENDYFLFTR